MSAHARVGGGGGGNGDGANMNDGDGLRRRGAHPEAGHGPSNDVKDGGQEAAKGKTARSWIRPALHPARDALCAWYARCRPWSSLKPILRSALLFELALVFLLIAPIERTMGQASFLILIGALISPAELPLAMTIEREVFNVGLALLAWAWSCLGLKLASLARDRPLSPSQVDYTLVYKGEYLDTRASVIMAAFLATGSAFFLYIKVAIGPSPYLFGSIFGAILMTIAATTGVLFPYPLYTIGQAIIVPLAIKAGLAIVLCTFFFPKSVNSLYIEKLLQLLAHVSAATRVQCTLFKKDPRDQETYDFMAVHNLVAQAEAAVAPLQGASRLLQRELSFGLLSGADLESLQEAAIALISPSDGWSYYMSMIHADLNSAHFPGTPAASRPASHASTPASTRPPSPDRSAGDEEARETGRVEGDARSDAASATERSQRHSADIDKHHLQHRLATALLRSHKPSSLHIGGHASKARYRSKSKPRPPVPVATFESLRFARVEAELHTRAADKHTARVHELLGEANRELLGACTDAMEEVIGLLKSINASRLGLFRMWLLRPLGGVAPRLRSPLPDARMTSAEGSAEKGGPPPSAQERIVAARQRLERALDEFRRERRHIVDGPFITAPLHASIPPALRDEMAAAAAEVPSSSASSTHSQSSPPPTSAPSTEVPHRYLYQAYVHVFHTISYGTRLLDLLRIFEELDCSHREARFWWPSLPHLVRYLPFLGRHGGSGPANGPSRGGQSGAQGGGSATIGHPDEADADEDETRVEGMHSRLTEQYAWCRTRRRDPDALEPRNALERGGKLLYDGLHHLFRGNILFAIKAGTLILIVSLPAYLKSSAEFFYAERGVWVLIMCQLTLMRWRGETLFGLMSRAVTTFFGCAIGLIIWYIGAGSGKGNSYAIAVVFGIASVPLAAWRLQGIGAPIALIIFTVTVGLVIGYSIKDSRNPAPSTVGWGFDVGWRRLVGVLIGVTAAGLWSLLPPSRTIRGYTRSLSATTIEKLGEIYCVVVTSAADPKHEGLDQTARNLMAVRAKLRRMAIVQDHASYELGLRGAWPKEQYAALTKTQMELAKLLSHLVLTLQRLHDSTTASTQYKLIEQTRFLDPTFLGDCISVFYMASTALRSATPLPQLTAAPLVHRFLLLESELARERERKHSKRTWRSAHHLSRGEDEDTFGFPRHFGEELLADEAFLTLSVALTTGFGILLRLDRLMVCTKALVGEAYPIGAASYFFLPQDDEDGDLPPKRG